MRQCPNGDCGNIAEFFDTRANCPTCGVELVPAEDVDIE